MKSYSLADFDRVPSAIAQVQSSINLDNLPSIEDVRLMAKWTQQMAEMFNREAEYFDPQPDGTKEDRSGALMHFAYLGAENGWTDEQIAAAMYDLDDRWGKYKERRDRDSRLVDFVNRARQKVGYNPVIDLDLSKLLGDKDPSVHDESGNGALIYGAQDFIDQEFKIEWLLEGLLAQGGFGLVTGYPGVGKTQFGIQMCTYLSLGYKNFLKWENKVGPKKVLFLSLEMSKAPLNHFMGQIANSYSQRDTWNRNFLVAPFGTPLPLDTKEGQEFFNRLLDEHMPDVVLIDSLQKISSKELTDELAVKALIHYLSVVREKYRCSVLVIHHNRKKANDGQKKLVELSDVYGSTYLTTDVDFVLSLKTLTVDTLSLEMLKNRLGPMVESIDLIRDSNLHFSDLNVTMVGSVGIHE